MKELLTVISFLEKISKEHLEKLSKISDNLIDEYDLSLNIFSQLSDILMSAGVMKATLESIIKLYKEDNNV